MKSTHRGSGVGFCILLALAQLPAAWSADGPLVKVKRKPTDAEWTERAARPVGQIEGFRPAAVPLDRFGGRSDRTARASGFFRVEQVDGRWWLVDPDGGLFLSVGVNGVRLGSTPTVQAALKERFGTPQRWAQVESVRLREAGFNSTGAWSDVPLLRAAETPLAYCLEGVAARAGDAGSAAPKGGFMRAFGRHLGVSRQGSGHALYPEDCIPVFHPDFAPFCDRHARPLADWKDDPWLLGYFTDNELPMPKLDKYLALNSEDPAMGSSWRAAREWLDARRGPGAAPTDADREAWIEFAYERYFAAVAGAIRRQDPQHLILGSRFYGAEKGQAAAFRAAGRHCDVIAVNHYGVWEPKPADIERWTHWSGRPVMITEWYAKGADSGYTNHSGAGWLVPTQRDRGLFYQTFTGGLLRAKNCVGWHWFRYMDNDPADTTADPSNVDSNKGVVTIRFEPYDPLLDAMRELNRTVYRLIDYLDSTGQTPR